MSHENQSRGLGHHIVAEANGNRTYPIHTVGLKLQGSQVPCGKNGQKQGLPMAKKA